MKRTLQRYALALLAALACGTLPLAAQTLTIVHTSDTHSCVDPISPNDPNPNEADKGGYIRRATLLKELRQTTPDLLLLDCGDFSQGSVYYNLFKGEVEVRLMNDMGYDACTIGNHEFDFGVENLARLLRMARFPVVCCNYDFSATPCAGLVKPYVVVDRAGKRIGILGVGPKLAGLVPKASYGDTQFTPPAEAAQPVVDHLRNEEGCDVVVCLSHLGLTEGPYGDPAFIRETRGIDLVLGGHSHTYLEHARYYPNADGRLIPLDHQGKNARYVGLIKMEY